METLPLLWPRKAAAARELPRFHHDPNSGRAELRFLQRKLAVNQTLPVGGSAARLHLARVNLPLPWNNTEELLESHRSDVQIQVNHHKFKKSGMCEGRGFFHETAALRSAYRVRDGKKEIGWLHFRQQNISSQTLIRRTHVHTEEPVSQS